MVRRGLTANYRADRAPCRSTAIVRAACLAASLLPVGMEAQMTCDGFVRQLPSGAQSARERLAAITRVGEREAHVSFIADAAGCGEEGPVVARRKWAMKSFAQRRDTLRLALHWPETRFSMLGGLADPRNSDGVWSGRGMTTYGTAAVSLDAGPLHLLVSPYLLWSENRRFEIYRSGDSLRNSFASPWYFGDYSLDLPSRMGASQFTELSSGNSALWFTAGSLEAGVSTSRQAWGPGLRAHLVLGADAPGIPRYFVRTAPIRSRIGSLSFSLFKGAVVESRFFDLDPLNDRRGLLGWTAAFTPGKNSGVGFGLSHAALSSRRDTARVTERMASLSVQARSPGDSFRGWAEVGRSGGLPAWRRFLTTPYEGIAYIVGFEYAWSRPSGTLLLSSEVVDLEQPRDILEVPPRDFYTSDVIPQGWSHRGRVLGVATGPGSQSQWISADWVEATWSAGLFGERVRWNEDAFLRRFLSYPNRHDVSLRAGLRGGVVVRKFEVNLELSTGKRINYLFQNGSYIPGLGTTDISIPQFRLSVRRNPST